MVTAVSVIHSNLESDVAVSSGDGFASAVGWSMPYRFTLRAGPCWYYACQRRTRLRELIGVKRGPYSSGPAQAGIMRLRAGPGWHYACQHGAWLRELITVKRGVYSAGPAHAGIMRISTEQRMAVLLSLCEQDVRATPYACLSHRSRINHTGPTYIRLVNAVQLEGTLGQLAISKALHGPKECKEVGNLNPLRIVKISVGSFSTASNNKQYLCFSIVSRQNSLRRPLVFHRECDNFHRELKYRHKYGYTVYFASSNYDVKFRNANMFTNQQTVENSSNSFNVITRMLCHARDVTFSAISGVFTCTATIMNTLLFLFRNFGAEYASLSETAAIMVSLTITRRIGWAGISLKSGPPRLPQSQLSNGLSVVISADGWTGLPPGNNALTDLALPIGKKSVDAYLTNHPLPTCTTCTYEPALTNLHLPTCIYQPDVIWPGVVDTTTVAQAGIRRSADVLFTPFCHLPRFAISAVGTFLCERHLPSRTGFNSQPGHPDFRKWESCQTMPLVCGFSRGCPVLPAPSFWCLSILTSIILIGSQDIAVKSRPSLFTHIYLPPLHHAVASSLSRHLKLLHTNASIASLFREIH
ncbi:hypothetical protein PR048_031997 [Dryococelus australis]|uniref:Uncharacterized protein n=1 Tax=Dryococelus australis TaxID=614101 RepID=A0ABQ9G7F3_9NEOP|nr:hypothetical protein PR048_031997 [Dryococelus australis]